MLIMVPRVDGSMLLQLLCLLQVCPTRCRLFQQERFTPQMGREAMSILSTAIQRGDLKDSELFRSHCSTAFRDIRLHHGFSDESYAKLFSPDNVEAILDSDSKSGQSMWRLRKGGVVLKCISDSEVKVACSLVSSSSDHAIRRPSALAVMLGVYEVRLRCGRRQCVMAMRDVLPIEARNKISRIIDIKGSLVGRLAADKTKVMKEWDLVASCKPILIGDKAKSELLAILDEDCRYLEHEGLMDFSVLVIEVPKSEFNRSSGSCKPKISSDIRNKIHVWSKTICFARALIKKALNFLHARDDGHDEHHTTLECTNEPPDDTRVTQDRGKLVIFGEKSVYYCAIIDYLQQYTIRKQIETIVKRLAGFDSTLVSCVDPLRYSVRLRAFMRHWLK